MKHDLQGVGIGLRRELVPALLNDTSDKRPSFLEFAPENWMGIGGYWKSVLQDMCRKYPVTCHGLSLSLGSPDPLDWDFLRDLKKFFKDYPVQLYSEHLSYCSCDNAHLYDLLPIPFTDDAVKHVVQRIREVQDFLERPLLIENVSYYTPVAPEMSEATFLSRILEESDCLLLLDVNNVYVNAFNHSYNAQEFIQSLPLQRVAYMHMAGHFQESEDLIIDTHGAEIAPAVMDLFEWTTRHLSPVPVLLERDFNIPPYEDLTNERLTLQRIAEKNWTASHVA